TDMKDNQVAFGKTAEAIIADAVKEYRYPVCFGFPAGHQTKNLDLILGRKARLTVGQRAILSYL
ncbi:MAG: LD-carboxypeptidase, partial [Bacteroidota bacterium]